MTYTELRDAVSAYLEEMDEPSFQAQMNNFIRMAEQQIYRLIPHRAIRKEYPGPGDPSLSVSQGWTKLEVPSDYLELHGVTLKEAVVTVDPGTGTLVTSFRYTPLRRVDTSYIREAYYNSGVRGKPEHYAVFSKGTLLIGPSPITTSNFVLDMTVFPESIVDAGTSWLGDNASEALLFGTLVKGYTFLKGEADLLQEYKAQFDRALQLLTPEADDAPMDQKVGTT